MARIRFLESILILLSKVLNLVISYSNTVESEGISLNSF